MNWLLQHGRRIARVALGLAVSLIGVALLVLPGPGTLFILTGLTILAVDFVWARRLKRRLGRKAIRAVRYWRRRRPKPAVPAPPSPPS